MTKKKQILLIVILALFSVSIMVAAIMYINGSSMGNEEVIMGEITATDGFINENLSLYEDTMALEDWNMTDYPYRVCIVNPSEFLVCEIDRNAVDALEPFLDLYMNMYDSSGLKYQGEVLVDTFIPNDTIPQFTVRIHLGDEEDLLVRCSYFVQAQLYEFYSSLSE